MTSWPGHRARGEERASREARGLCPFSRIRHLPAHSRPTLIGTEKELTVESAWQPSTLCPTLQAQGLLPSFRGKNLKPLKWVAHREAPPHPHLPPAT